MKVCKLLYLLTLSIAATPAATKKVEFHVSESDLAKQPNRTTQEKVTVAASTYIDSTTAKPLFGGKANPYDEGILPVLVMIKNESNQTISLRKLRIEFLISGKTKIDPTPPVEVPYIHGSQKVRLEQSKIPGGSGRMKTKKNPFQVLDFQERGFAAKMLPPGEFASGFFYFQSGLTRGSKLLVQGLTEAGSGKELFFFELPLD